MERAKESKRLVIDTSVARAAGKEDAKDVMSKQCRDFLTAVFLLCHRVVITTAIREEWDRHQSGFTREWYVRMKRSGRKVEWVTVESNERWRSRISRLSVKENDRDAMLKDVLLIEAAYATDRIVISCDEIARSLFHTAAGHISEFKYVLWANPLNEVDQVILWLQNSAPDDKHRHLGYQPEDED